MFDFLANFWIFLDKYPAKSDIIDLIKTTAGWKSSIVIGYSQFFKKNNDLQKSTLNKSTLFCGNMQGGSRLVRKFLSQVF